MINVLNIIDTGGPGGAETVFLQIATRLDAARFRSVAAVGGEGWLAQRLREGGLPPCIVPAKGSFNVRYLSALFKLALRHKPDVIVAHLYGSAIYAGVLGRILRIPVISILHGQTDVARSGRLSSLKSAIVRSCSRQIVFVSARLKNDLELHLGVSASRCAVIPNGVDTELFFPSRDRGLRDEIGLPDETHLVGAVGNVRRPKAYDVLLQAARYLVGGSERFHFVIAGECSGPLGEALTRLAGDLGIERHVTFLGLRSDVARILNNLDVFVLSSSTEGFSIACIEAMACGVPIVATRSGGPEEILEGGAGVLVPTGDPQAIALAVKHIASSKDTASALTAAAASRVRREFSLARMLARYEELLVSVAHKPREGRGPPG